ncbi:MAG: LacI family DNA-binding transcriptional regulator, partial [Marinomonas sp.]
HGVLKAALEFGLEVPRDLSLISFDNSPSVRFTQPPLTAIDQPVAETASIAAELLIAAQKGEEPPKEKVVVPAKLIERSSVAPPAR